MRASSRPCGAVTGLAACAWASPPLRAGASRELDPGPHERDQDQSPRNSASVNPAEKIRITIPISNTRFVEANWNAIAVARLAPFWNIDLAIATAAYCTTTKPHPGRWPRDRAQVAAAERLFHARTGSTPGRSGEEEPSTSAQPTSRPSGTCSKALADLLEERPRASVPREWPARGLVDRFLHRSQVAAHHLARVQALARAR